MGNSFWSNGQGIHWSKEVKTEVAGDVFLSTSQNNLVRLILNGLRCCGLTQAIFNDTEEFVISIDEGNNEVVTWDARTAEKVAKWPSNHNGVPRWIEHSPVESVFVTCGTTDRSVRFWKESV